jgi:hypothetical protein
MPGRIKGKMLAAGSTIEGADKTSVALSTADVVSSITSVKLPIADSAAGWTIVPTTVTVEVLEAGNIGFTLGARSIGKGRPWGKAMP